jgi:hypothetical protein
VVSSWGAAAPHGSIHGLAAEFLGVFPAATHRLGGIRFLFRFHNRYNNFFIFIKFSELATTGRSSSVNVRVRNDDLTLLDDDSIPSFIAFGVLPRETLK